MRVLITGAGGFIGRSLCEYLEKYGVYQIIPITRDDVNLEYDGEVDLFFSINEFDTIIHCAGNAVVKVDENHPSIHIDSNVKATNNLLHYCQPKTHIIYLSTIVAYGDTPNVITEDCQLNPTSVYAASKIAGEFLLQAQSNLKSLVPCVIRPSAIVGEYATHGVVYDFVRKLISDAPRHTVLGKPPGSRKPYLHVKDLCSFIKQAIDNRQRGLFNLGPCDTLSSEQIARIVMDAIKINKKIEWVDQNWAGDNRTIRVCPVAARNAGWEPSMTSEQAVYAAAREIYARHRQA